MPNPPGGKLPVLYRGSGDDNPYTHGRARHHGRGFGGVTKDVKPQKVQMKRPDEDVADHADMATNAPSSQFTDGASQPQPQQPSPMDDLQQYAQNPYGGGGGYGGGGSPFDSGGDFEGVDEYEAGIESDHDAIDADVDDGMSVSGGALGELYSQNLLARIQDQRYRVESYARGRLGFMLTLGTQQTQFVQQVLSIEEPAEQASEWTLTLNAVRFASGGITSPIGADLDHAVASSFPFASVAVRLEWGVDGAYESCVIDYPTRGASISICASTIRVSIIQTTSFSVSQPTVGGFLTPHGKRQGSYYDAMTRTLLAQLPAAVTPVFVPIPDRARSYRLMSGIPDASLGTQFYSVQQVDGQTGATIFSNDGQSAFDPTDIIQNEYLAKIHPLAQAIRVSNTPGTPVAHNVYIQFDLDLG